MAPSPFHVSRTSKVYSVQIIFFPSPQTARVETTDPTKTASPRVKTSSRGTSRESAAAGGAERRARTKELVQSEDQRRRVMTSLLSGIPFVC